MKIKQLEVINFQSHKHTIVDFDNFTVFVGQTDQGKTSLAKRAIMWCLFNQPQGDSFIREENGIKAKVCKVKIKFDNGVIIERIKDKGKNIYKLMDKNGTEHIYENFGNDVPEEIRKARGIDVIKIDDEEEVNVNIIGARDPSIVNQSNFFKTKILSHLANTTIIDTAIDLTDSEKRNLSSTAKQIKSVLSDLEIQIEQYKCFVKAYDELQNLKAVLNQLETKFNHYTQLQSILQKLQEKLKEKNILEQQIKELQNIDKYEVRIKTIVQAFENLKEKINEFNSLQEKVSKYQTLHKYAEQQQLIIKKLQFIDIIEKKFISVVQLTQELQHKSNRLEVIKKLVNKYKDLCVNKQTQQETLKKTQNIEKWQQCFVKTEEILKNLQDRNQKLESLKIAYEQYKELKNRQQTGRMFLEKTKVEIAQKVKMYIFNIEQIKICPVCLNEINDKCISKIKKDLLQ